MKHHILNETSFAIAAGVTCAATYFTIAILAMQGKATILLTVLNSLYPSYTPTPLGSIIGALWGFLTAFVLGYLFSITYNKLA